jgi:hypothetical protein
MKGHNNGLLAYRVSCQQSYPLALVKYENSTQLYSTPSLSLFSRALFSIGEDVLDQSVADVASPLLSRS